MPETIVVKGEHGLPYSKGLMAQSLSASGLAPDRAYEVARVIESRLAERSEPDIDVEGLRRLAAEAASTRARRWPGGSWPGRGSTAWSAR
jgi:2-phosphoglycerate kinase